LLQRVNDLRFGATNQLRPRAVPTTTAHPERSKRRAVIDADPNSVRKIASLAISNLEAANDFVLQLGHDVGVGLIEEFGSAGFSALASPESGKLLPYGTEQTGHGWLHSRCWEVWHANRKAKAVTILSLTVGAG
jgi:hypothetical protein